MVYLTASGDKNHYPSIDQYVGRLTVAYEEASAYGFQMSVWGMSDTYKVDRIKSRNADGTNTYQAYFTCNAEEQWLDQNVSFEVEDVTPTAYANMFQDMGIAYQGPRLTVESAASYINNLQGMGYTLKIQEPFTENGPGDKSEAAFSGKSITIEAGTSVRVVKLTAKKGNGRGLCGYSC